MHVIRPDGGPVVRCLVEIVKEWEGHYIVKNRYLLLCQQNPVDLSKNIQSRYDRLDYR